MIKVIYNKVCGRCVQSEPLTSGMVGQPIHFEYSHDFDGLTLTAVFTNGKTTVDVLNPGNQCVIPHEVLDTVGTLVKVGIYAVKGDELVIPTIYAHIGVVLKGADPIGDVSADPTLPVWAQIEALMGNLNDLNTEAKNNLVAAINEAAQTGGGGASIAMRVDGGYIQYSTDEGKTWVNLIAESELKGDKGDKGADGVNGVDGKDGAPGKDGTDGKDGTNGITPHIGENGNWYIGNTDTGKPSRGEQGVKGDTGPQGLQGIQGVQGPQGERGPAGADGATGPQGPVGPKGGTGDTGPAGQSAYAYAVDGGYKGTETEFAEKLAQEQLTGTTNELTPTQVYDAVSAGIPVKVQHTDSEIGVFAYTAFAIAETIGVIAANTIAYYNGQYILGELVGIISTDSWNFMKTTLAQKADIPTDDHINSLIDTKLGVIENGAY